MATVAFTDTSTRVVKEVSIADKRSAKVLPDHSSSKIIEVNFTAKNFESVSYPVSKPINEKIHATAKAVLPFRISFTSVTVEGYTSRRPAPVGIAIVGVNNYIL